MIAIFTYILLFGVSAGFWRYYAELAFEYNRNRTGYAFLGMCIYIVGYLIGWVLTFFAIAIIQPEMESLLALTLLFEGICIAFGSGVAWLVRYLLKKNWERFGALPERTDVLDR